MLLFFSPPVNVSVLDIGPVVAAMPAAFGASGFTDLEFWGEAEFYQYADAAAKRLARTSGGFVVRDTSLSLVPSQATYTLPSRHISTLHVSRTTTSLSYATLHELECLDATWPDTSSATPARYVNDRQGLEAMLLYPKPNGAASGTLAVIFHRFPAGITSAAAAIEAPVVISPYFAFAVLAGGKGKESKMMMPEVAAWATEQMGMMEQLIVGYWGTAQ